MQLKAQESTVIQLTQEEAEALLLQNNLSLLAQQLNIDIAEAEMIQAKVWPNPTLSIDEVNLWATDYQKRNGEALPSLFGSENFGKYRQVAAQIEQLVELAGKRKKRIAIEEVDQKIATAYLEDFLLSLRTEFREKIYEYEYSEAYIALLQNQINSITTLITAYKQQLQEGNISKADIIRLQATQFALKDDIIDEKEQLHQLEQELIVMLNLPDNTTLQFNNIFDETLQYNTNKYTLNLANLQEQALKMNPQFQAITYGVTKAEKQLDYEKSLRVPDLTFSVGYDRGGNIMQDFVGVGIAFDLPIFDTNKGGIKRATAEKTQAELLQQEHELTIKTQVRERLKNLEQIASFFEPIDTTYVNDLELSMQAYNQFFKDQTVNMIGYLDFMEAYIDNMRILYQNQVQFLTALEELNYITGMNLQHQL